MRGDDLKVKRPNNVIILLQRVYVYIFLAAMFSISIPMLHKYTGRYIKFVLLFGFFSIAVDAFYRRGIFKNKNKTLIILFLSTSVLTILLNFRLNAIVNLTQFLYNSIFLLLFFPACLVDSEDSAQKHFINFSLFFILISFIAAFASLILYFIQFSAVIDNVRIGFYLGRLWGVYTSPNAGGIYAIISIVLSTYCYKRLSKNCSKIKNILNIAFFILNLAVQLIFISLTDSNSSILTILVLLSFYILFKSFYSAHRPKPILHFGIVFMKIVFSCLITVIALKLTSYLVGYIPPALVSLSDNQAVRILSTETTDDQSVTFAALPQLVPHNKPTTSYAKLPHVDTGRRYKDTGGFASGRLAIWKMGLSTLKNNPLFGVGQENVYEIANEMYPEHPEITKKLKSGTHNLYIQTLVSTGIIGSIFFFCLLFKSIFLCVKKVSYHYYAECIGILALVLCMLFNNIAESTIYFCQSGIGCIFWFCLGFCLSKADYKSTNGGDHI